MTYSRKNGIERVINNDGTLLFYQKGNRREVEVKPEVTIPRFPQPGKPILLLTKNGGEKICNEIPKDARFLNTSIQFNIYQEV